MGFAEKEQVKSYIMTQNFIQVVNAAYNMPIPTYLKLHLSPSKNGPRGFEMTRKTISEN